MYIRQKNSSLEDDKTYTVVVSTIYVDINGNEHSYSGAISSHPSLIEHPELFELSSVTIPDDAQSLIYHSF